MSWPSVSRSWTERLQFCPCDSSCRFGREFCVSGDKAPHSGMHQTQRFFAIVNPAAGGGRSAKLAGPALARLRQNNLQVDSVASTCPGHAVELAREAYDQGYLLRVFVRVVQLHRRSFALRCDEDQEWDERCSLFLTFNNSKYTGGTMLIAPQADPADGLIEFVRWGPIGRLGLLRNLPRLYDGSHVHHPLASRRAVRHVEFNVAEPVDIMIDGEVARLECRSLDIIPSALDVFL